MQARLIRETGIHCVVADAIREAINAGTTSKTSLLQEGVRGNLNQDLASKPRSLSTLAQRRWTGCGVQNVREQYRAGLTKAGVARAH